MYRLIKGSDMSSSDKPVRTAKNNTTDHTKYINSKKRNVRSEGRPQVQRTKKRASSVDKLAYIDKINSLAGFLLFILQLVLSIVFIILLSVLNVLPGIYIILAAVLMLIILAGVWLLRLPGKQNRYKRKNEKYKLKLRIRRVISLVISLIMCFVLTVGSYYIHLTDKALNTVTGDGYEITVYKVAVLDEDPAEKITDTQGYLFGILSDDDQISDAIELIEDEAKFDIKTSEYSAMDKLLDGLYDGKVGGIIYKSSYGGMFEDIREDYGKDVRIICEVKIKTSVENDPDGQIDDTAQTAEIEPFILLLSGNDEYDEVSVVGRSDVNMLAVVNFEKRQLILISIPRDYYVQFPGVTGESRDKLTHAGIYGMDTLCDSIGQLFDTNVDYYCRVNFTSVIDIINAIGGVEFYNPDEFYSETFEHLFPEGTYWYDGYWALQYMRERYAFKDGDITRGKHQQIILEAMINQIVSAESLTNYTSLISAIEKCAVTNMPESEIKSIVKQQLAEGGEWNIMKTQAKGDGEDMFQPSYAMDGLYVSVVMPYKESVDSISSLIKKCLNGEEITEEDLAEPTSYTYITDIIE